MTETFFGTVFGIAGSVLPSRRFIRLQLALRLRVLNECAFCVPKRIIGHRAVMRYAIEANLVELASNSMIEIRGNADESGQGFICRASETELLTRLSLVGKN